MSEPRLWVATPVSGFPYMRHLLVEGGGSTLRSALCGERHRRWDPVESFARPDVFEECPICARLGGTQ